MRQVLSRIAVCALQSCFRLAARRPFTPPSFPARLLEEVLGIQMPAMRRCKHGVYWPVGQEIAFCCSLCNSAGNAGAAPVLPKTGDGNPAKTDQRETCSQCGNLRLYSQSACLYCATPFPAGDAMARRQGIANAKQPGTCPECNSGVHYPGAKPGIWECA